MRDAPTPSASSRRLRLTALVIVGALFGLGTFAMFYGNGLSYLSSNPAYCANCHVMDGHYASWQASGHAHVAACNDCHLSTHPVGKWVTKADNGFFHSLAFTTGAFPDPIRIKDRNSRRTQQACLKCHQDFANALLPVDAGGGMLECVHCHASVGHATR